MSKAGKGIYVTYISPFVFFSLSFNAKAVAASAASSDSIALIASVAILATVLPNKNRSPPAPAYRYQGNPPMPSENNAWEKYETFKTMN